MVSLYFIQNKSKISNKTTADEMTQFESVSKANLDTTRLIFQLRRLVCRKKKQELTSLNCTLYKDKKRLCRYR